VAAAEHQAGDADAGAGARGYGHALRGQPPVDVDQLGAGADDRLAAADPDAAEPGDVEDEAVVAGGVAGVGVAAVAYGDLQAVRLGVAEGGAYVVGVCHVGDRGGLEAVEAGVVQLVRRPPRGVTGPDQGAVQVTGEGRPVRGGALAGGLQGREGR
jgi:hypothetical protein